jgi:hypothetical protein
MNQERPFKGMYVGLSVSESSESVGLGFPNVLVNRVTLQITAALLGQGAGIVFGHDWREDGVMEAVHAFAQRFHSTGASEDAAPPMLVNVLPWPIRPSLDLKDRDRLKETLLIEQAGLPEALGGIGVNPMTEDDSRFPYYRARALTHLRRRLSSIADAFLCIGGRTSGFHGRYPGVIEEAYFALATGKPLFIAGALGGASKAIAGALEHAPVPKLFDAPRELESQYVEQRKLTPNADEDATIDSDRVWAAFRSVGTQGISQTNGLSPAENQELFNTLSIDRVIELVLHGLANARLRPS